MLRSTRFALGALLASALILGMACGGKSSSSSSSSGSGSANSSQAASNSGQIDLSTSVKNVEALQSFKFDLALKLDAANALAGTDSDIAALLGGLNDIKASGSVVGPDQLEVTANLGGQQLGFVQIGKKAWTKFGGSWTSDDSAGGFSLSDLGDLTSMGGSSSQALPEEFTKNAKITKEKVNGVDATRYSLDKAALTKLAKDSGQSDIGTIDKGSIDLWMSGDNIPVKLVVDVATTDSAGKKSAIRAELNITNLNDKSIKIKPPI